MVRMRTVRQALIALFCLALMPGCRNPFAPSFTVTYDGNGSTSGTVPVDSGTYQQGQSVTVLDNSGSLAKPGCSFAGWVTRAGGDADMTCAPGETFVMGTSDLTLYALWASSANAITAFGFPAHGAVGVIDEPGSAISVSLPHGTPLAGLVAAFTTTGASVAVGTAVQVSGTTANDFTGPVAYVVTAEDGTTRTYVVTAQAPSNDAGLSGALLGDTMGGTYSYDPAFSPTTYIYRNRSAQFTDDTLTYTLTLTTTEPDATIVSVTEYGGGSGDPVDPHTGSVYTLTLDGSTNYVTIVVRAPDGATTATYTMIIDVGWGMR